MIMINHDPTKYESYQTNERTDKPQNYMPPYYRMVGIKNIGFW